MNTENPKEFKSSKRLIWRFLRLGFATRIALTVALIFVTVGLTAIGTTATFTGVADTSSNNPIYSSCTLSLAAITPSGANNRLVIGASNIVPGDTIQRAVNVKNSGSSCLDSSTPVKLTTRASSCVGTCQSSLLDTDTTNGLQMAIQKCSVAWTESGGPPYTYTCSGTTSSVLASTPVIQTNATLSNINGTAGTDNFLVVTLTFPSTAGNTFQGLTSRIEYSFEGQQRAAAAQ